MSLTFVLSAFFLGLFGSTHCVAMCGGVVTLLSSSRLVRHKRESGGAGEPAPIRAAGGGPLAALAYNAGRLSSYAAAGALAGGFGVLANRIEVLSGVQLGLRLIAGLMMVAVGLYLAGLWSKVAIVERLGAPLWSRIQPLAKRLLPVKSLKGAFALGTLWGFLPCGLVYAALGAALGTGSARYGALTMTAFFLGTLPSLLAMSAFADRLSTLLRKGWLRRTAGLAVVAFGLVNVRSAALQADIVSSGGTCCPQPHGIFPADTMKK